MGQNETTRNWTIKPPGVGLRMVLVFGSIYQGKPFWVRILDPQPAGATPEMRIPWPTFLCAEEANRSGHPKGDCSIVGLGVPQKRRLAGSRIHLYFVAVDPSAKSLTFCGFSGMKTLDFPKSQSLKIQPNSSQVSGLRIQSQHRGRTFFGLPFAPYQICYLSVCWSVGWGGKGVDSCKN